MRRPAISLLTVLTPQKRRQLDDCHSPSPKRLCLWSSVTVESRTKEWSTLKHRRPHRQLNFTKRTPSSTSRRSPLVHSARKIRRPQVRLSSRSRSKSLTRLSSSRSSSSASRKRKLEWWLSDAHVMERGKCEGLRRPRVSLLNPLGVYKKKEVKKRSRSLSLSSSSVKSNSYDPDSCSPLVRRKRLRTNSMFTPPSSRTRKSNQKLLLTRSATKSRLRRTCSRLQVMNRTKVNKDTVKSSEAQLVELQTSTQRLMVQLASATLKMEALNRESTFYKNVVAEIQSVISLNTTNRVLFSSFPNMRL